MPIPVATARNTRTRWVENTHKKVKPTMGAAGRPNKTRMARNMAAAHRRHDISDQVWKRLRPLWPGEAGQRGRPAQDNRLFLNEVFWILRTGRPGGTCRRITGTGRTLTAGFCRWRDRDVWERLLDSVIDDPDFEWLMIEASYIKVHPHGAGPTREPAPVHRRPGSG